MVIFGLLGFFGSFGAMYFYWGFAFGGIVTLIMGIIAVVGARSASTCLGYCFDNCGINRRRIRWVACASGRNTWSNNSTN